MLSFNLVLGVSLVYVALLFAVAFVGDRRARAGRPGWLQSPLVYTLSISIYCTSWTFYGAVGSAARNGLEYATIYLGPTLVFVGWWVLLRKLVHIGRLHSITSIADMVSSRYGKSASLAALVTLIAVVGTTPYIALQLQAVTTSLQVISNPSPDALLGLTAGAYDFRFAFWIAAGMAVFTIAFGTRNIHANEQHHGVVAAIAVEAVVKLVALLAVGLLVVIGMSGGVGALFARAPPELMRADVFGPRWVTLTFLAAAAIVCLPREFHVTIVENTDPQHLRTASWLFPLYLLLISLFVLPIAIAGLHLLPSGANPDLFVLTLPMLDGQDGIALLAFLGGFSSATSMVIVASIALSTMISNHLVMPVALRFGWVAPGIGGEIRHFLLVTRRLAIGLILLLGFVYFRLSGESDALAAIGLISFSGVAQILPALIGGLFWRRANAAGAIAGLVAGALLWAYTLFLPSFGGQFVLSATTIDAGPFGLTWLAPQALFGLQGVDPLVHSLGWSLGVNTLLFVLVSLLREQRPLERLQATLFVDAFRAPAGAASGLIRRSAATYDLSLLAHRTLGRDAAQRLLRDTGQDSSNASDVFISQLERKLAGAVGAASARAMISQVVTGETISLDALMKLADETQRARDHSAELDEFLSQVSHEVRTPMTAIRSFSEILLDAKNLPPEQAEHFVRIIHEQCLRLTRLLDGILDLSLLERGETPWQLGATDPEAALDGALRACHALAITARVRLEGDGQRARGVVVEADADRLTQVFINLIANAVKYHRGEQRWVRVTSRVDGDGVYEVLVEDNGPGIAAEQREVLFSKFRRGSSDAKPAEAGAGLGLAISWQIMRRLGGSLTLLPDNGCGARFRVALPLQRSRKPAIAP